MNQMILQGKWRQQRGAARETWGRLMKNDSQMYNGKADRLLGSLEERVGRSRVRAEREVKDLLKQYHLPDSIPIASKLMNRPKKRNFMVRHPWMTVSLISALIMVVRFLMSRTDQQSSAYSYQGHSHQENQHT